jgi:hypothetical protein
VHRQGDGPGQRAAIKDFGDVGVGLIGCPACDHYRILMESITVQLLVY